MRLLNEEGRLEREALEAEESSSVCSKLEVRWRSTAEVETNCRRSTRCFTRRTFIRQRKDEGELVKLRTELSKIQHTHEQLIHRNAELERKLKESFKQMSRPISRGSSYHDLIDPSD
jgi:hypothetical protein